MRPCFAFSAKTATKPAVLAIDDEIGFWGVQARDFRAALDAVEGETLEVQINSVGGDVMAGLGMYNMLRNWAGAGKQITTRVTGMVGSSAYTHTRALLPQEGHASTVSAGGGSIR